MEKQYSTSETLAIISLVCGIIALFTSSLLIGAAAIVLALVSRSYSFGYLSVKAKAGLICGVIAVALRIILVMIALNRISSVQ